MYSIAREIRKALASAAKAGRLISTSGRATIRTPPKPMTVAIVRGHPAFSPSRMRDTMIIHSGVVKARAKALASNILLMA